MTGTNRQPHTAKSIRNLCMAFGVIVGLASSAGPGAARIAGAPSRPISDFSSGRTRSPLMDICRSHPGWTLIGLTSQDPLVPMSLRYSSPRGLGGATRTLGFGIGLRGFNWPKRGFFAETILGAGVANLRGQEAWSRIFQGANWRDYNPSVGRQNRLFVLAGVGFNF